MRYQNTSFRDTEVELDGHEFINCTFEDCTVIFRGKGPVVFDNNTFRNVDWLFSDCAALTLQFLGGIYTGMGEGGRKLIEITLKNFAQQDSH
ncbi:MAG: hypothetical protein IBX64_09790 [Actinobacteria bacterium]|nr:hypothetical protein [Actinomycetota bacterium]